MKMRPNLVAQNYETVGTVAIGRNLVAMMMEGNSFEVMDLGIDVSPEQFVEAVKDGVDIIALSALLTTTMTSMKDTIDALNEAWIRDKVKVLIGGAPVTQDYATEIGADGYGPDAATGAELARELLGA